MARPREHPAEVAADGAGAHHGDCELPGHGWRF
jgi:hypothetical protein